MTLWGRKRKERGPVSLPLYFFPMVDLNSWFSPFSRVFVSLVVLAENYPSSLAALTDRHALRVLWLLAVASSHIAQLNDCYAISMLYLVLSMMQLKWGK